ncbi:MAG TPA: endo-1,4-beta-xylanase, partial [Polyangiaceae bacterium]|nr:endo-1,4-beta-xylanase [Polyangiaceae bacterium]
MRAYPLTLLALFSLIGCSGSSSLDPDGGGAASGGAAASGGSTNGSGGDVGNAGAGTGGSVSSCSEPNSEICGNEIGSHCGYTF